jgi:hypothetical protein
MNAQTNRIFPRYRGNHFPPINLGEITTPTTRMKFEDELSVENIANEMDNMSSQKTPNIGFWFEDMSSLFKTIDIIPNETMTDAERLNAMTRVVILISAIMFILKVPIWWFFLSMGLLVTVVLWYIMKGREHEYIRRQKEYLRPPRCSKNPKRSIITPVNPIIQPIQSIQQMRIVPIR